MIKNVEESYTRKNPDGTYRAWAEKIGTFRIEAQGMGVFLFGDLINRLGRYEALGPVSELEKKLKK